MTETAAAPAEGWGVIRPRDRRAHYYRDGMSLCRRVGFYNGSLEPDTGQSPDDCAACRKALGKEAAARTAAHDGAAKPDPTAPERPGAEETAGETPR